MGKALDWLGPDGCATVAGQLLRDTEVRSGQVWAWCPWHEESSKGGFSYNPAKDIGHCRSCGASGDLIKLFGDISGLEQGNAFREFRSRYAPHVRQDRRPAVSTPRMPQSIQQVRVDAKPVTLPTQQWMDRATRLAEKAHAELLANQEQMDWLSARGITKKTVIRRRLGWLESDYMRPYPSWGLPAATWDDGNERKHKVPRGLLIPMLDGDRVIRLRVRQPEKDPKYYVVIGGAVSPQPLMVLDSTWPGQHQAVILVEAELDAIFLAQEAGDIVTVVALGSAQTRPHDERSHRTVAGAAWVGLWVDRDAAGDAAVHTWTISTRKPDHPEDGGLSAALGVDAEDIRPRGDGKMDPGDCHKAGLSVRDHILRSVPNAWRIGPCAIGIEQEGGGAEKQGQGSAEARTMIVAESVKEFGDLLKLGPLVCKSSDAGMSVMAVKRDGTGKLVQDAKWEAFHWELMRKISDMFWYDEAVFNFIDEHPSAATGVHGKNYWAPLGARKQER